MNCGWISFARLQSTGGFSMQPYIRKSSAAAIAASTVLMISPTLLLHQLLAGDKRHAFQRAAARSGAELRFSWCERNGETYRTRDDGHTGWNLLSMATLGQHHDRIIWYRTVGDYVEKDHWGAGPGATQILVWSNGTTNELGSILEKGCAKRCVDCYAVTYLNRFRPRTFLFFTYISYGTSMCLCSLTDATCKRLLML